MTSTSATVSSKGWVVIPQELRRKYGLRPGSRVQVVDYGGSLAIVPVPEDPIATARGMLAGEPSGTRELLEERRREQEREDA